MIMYFHPMGLSADRKGTSKSNSAGKFDEASGAGELFTLCAAGPQEANSMAGGGTEITG